MPDLLSVFEFAAKTVRDTYRSVAREFRVAWVSGVEAAKADALADLEAETEVWPGSADFDDNPLDMHPGAFGDDEWGAGWRRGWESATKAYSVGRYLKTPAASTTALENLPVSKHWLFVDEGRCGDCPAPPDKPCCPDGTRCTEVRCILRYGHPGAHLAEATKAPAASAVVERDPGADVPPTSAPSVLSVRRVHAVLEVLAEHRFSHVNHSSIGPRDHCLCGYRPDDQLDWNAHVAPVIAQRIAQK